MKPVLFSFGSLSLYSFGVMVGLGILLSITLMMRHAKREGIFTRDDIFDFVFVIVFFGFIGGRLFYVFENFSYYVSNPLSIFKIWEGGLIFYGGQLFALLGGLLFVRRKKMSLWPALDFVTPYIALSHAFGRIGCFLNGCCYGKFCDLPWGVKFPRLGYHVHPTQLYEAFFNVALFVFLYVLTPKKKFKGQIALLYFMGYAMSRFTIEFWREPSVVWASLTSNQWFSLAVFFVSAWEYRRRKISSLGEVSS